VAAVTTANTPLSDDDEEEEDDDDDDDDEEEEEEEEAAQLVMPSRSANEALEASDAEHEKPLHLRRYTPSEGTTTNRESTVGPSAMQAPRRLTPPPLMARGASAAVPTTDVSTEKSSQLSNELLVGWARTATVVVPRGAVCATLSNLRTGKFKAFC
jgi:hypothetical protein